MLNKSGIQTIMIKQNDGKLNFDIEILFNANIIFSIRVYDLWFIHIYDL